MAKRFDVNKMGEWVKPFEIEIPNYILEDEPLLIDVKRVNIRDIGQKVSAKHPELAGIVDKSKRYTLAQDSGNTEGVEDVTEDELFQLEPLFHAVAKEAMVSPTYKEIYDAGGELNYAQVFTIFSHVGASSVMQNSHTEKILSMLNDSTSGEHAQ
jgi:hypothetical protein